MTLKEARALDLRIGGEAMTEDPFIIQINIAHYRAMLKLDMNDTKRSVIERLLAEAERNLRPADALEESRRRSAQG